MLKAAIEKVEQMTRAQIVTIGSVSYTVDRDGIYNQIKPDYEAPMEHALTSLDAVIAMIWREGLAYAKSKGSPVFVSVPAHDRVEVYLSPQAEDRYSRIFLYHADAADVPGWDASVKLQFDQAAVALQTRFQEGGDRDYTLNLLSMISTGAKVTYNDTGIATNIVTQRGISLAEQTQIRPLVRLRPYRTFQEVEQPEGLFLLRIDERGITFTEADGGMWKLAARRTVAEYLRSNLAAAIEDNSLVVML